MDWQSILNIVAGAVLTAIGWWCREIWDSLKSLKSDIQRIEIDLPKTYVSKAEINTRFDKIDLVLERIFDKLDHKADK